MLAPWCWGRSWHCGCRLKFKIFSCLQCDVGEVSLSLPFEIQIFFYGYTVVLRKILALFFEISDLFYVYILMLRKIHIRYPMRSLSLSSPENSVQILQRSFRWDYKPRSHMCISMQKISHICLLKIMQTTSEFGGLWKLQNNPSCTKKCQLRVFRILKLHSIGRRSAALSALPTARNFAFPFSFNLLPLLPQSDVWHEQW